MTSEIGLVVVASLLGSALLTVVVRKVALSRGMLDTPNVRSSHRVPTPRGGGGAIVLTSMAAWFALARMNVLPINLLLALSGGGLAVAVVGLLDDYFQLRASIRLLVHVAAAVWALAWLGGLPPIGIGNHVVSLGWGGALLGIAGIVWALNLFNFMDGIDGIAASETVFVAWSGALLALLAGIGGGVVAAALVLGAACGGFLLWNWPPARIFMGDVGSGYVGFALVVLAVAAARESPVALFVWLILGGVFVVDATVTLARRLLRCERPYEAHRSHAYQWLARRWGSHRRVTIAVIVVNILWLFPLALLAMTYPALAVWIAMGALVPIAILVAIAGGGRKESE